MTGAQNLKRIIQLLGLAAASGPASGCFTMMTYDKLVQPHRRRHFTGVESCRVEGQEEERHDKGIALSVVARTEDGRRWLLEASARDRRAISRGRWEQRPMREHLPQDRRAKPDRRAAGASGPCINWPGRARSIRVGLNAALVGQPGRRLTLREIRHAPVLELTLYSVDLSLPPAGGRPKDEQTLFLTRHEVLHEPTVSWDPPLHPSTGGTVAFSLLAPLTVVADLVTWPAQLLLAAIVGSGS